MEYIERVLKETLRLFPPLPMLVRYAKGQTKLGKQILIWILLSIIIYGQRNFESSASNFFNLSSEPFRACFRKIMKANWVHIWKNTLSKLILLDASAPLDKLVIYDVSRCGVIWTPPTLLLGVRSAYTLVGLRYRRYAN